MAKRHIVTINCNKYLCKDGKHYKPIWENEDKAFLLGIAKDHGKPYVITQRQEIKYLYGPIVTVYTLWELAF